MRWVCVYSHVLQLPCRVESCPFWKSLLCPGPNFFCILWEELYSCLWALENSLCNGSLVFVILWVHNIKELVRKITGNKMCCISYMLHYHDILCNCLISTKWSKLSCVREMNNLCLNKACCLLGCDTVQPGRN